VGVQRLEAASGVVSAAQRVRFEAVRHAGESDRSTGSPATLYQALRLGPLSLWEVRRRDGERSSDGGTRVRAAIAQQASSSP
jgi:hypothetical protein